MALNIHDSKHNITLANMYFDIDSKNAEGKVKCRKCDAMCKDIEMVTN